MSYKIYAPNIHLFAYHLQHDANPELLYNKCDEILAKFKINDFNLPQRINLSKDLEAMRVDLLKPEEIPSRHHGYATFTHQMFLETRNVNFPGFAYPLRIQDSYVLALNIRRPEKEYGDKTLPIDTAILGNLNPDNCLLPDFIQSSLGQTILITAWLTAEPTQPDWKYWQLREEGKNKIESIANECVKSFLHLPENPQYYRQGELFGSPILEYRIIKENGDYQPILIWLFCHKITETKFTRFYQDFIDLFLDLNRINQAYRNSRAVLQSLEINYKNIEIEINNFQDVIESYGLTYSDLTQLEKQLINLAKTGSKYTKLLRELEAQRHTISMSLSNYVKKLKSIKLKITAESSSPLSKEISFLESYRKNFYEFQKQIKADLGYFVPGSALLNQAIASIRGIVDITQAKSDRTIEQLLRQQQETEENHYSATQASLREQQQVEEQRHRHLQRTIAMAALGLGGTQIATGISPYIIPQQPTKPILPPFTSHQLHPATISLLFTLGWGIFGVFIGKVCSSALALKR